MTIYELAVIYWRRWWRELLPLEDEDEDEKDEAADDGEEV